MFHSAALCAEVTLVMEVLVGADKEPTYAIGMRTIGTIGTSCPTIVAQLPGT
jgi:hypothetical protein